MSLIIIISTLGFAAVILFLRNGLYRLNSCTNTTEQLSFSVVIAARNEERNIEKCLQSVFSQELPAERYEVIVINDRSEDSTPEVLSNLQNRFKNLKVITITETPSGISPKKHAVTKGIESAVNEIIVFTDADCTVKPQWLLTVNNYFEADTGLVQGITSYGYVNGMDKLFFGLQAIDFLSHGVIAAAAIGANLPINSNANNLAFRKRVFEEIGGYGNDSRVVLGDDDHLLQRVWKSGRFKVRFMADSRANVETEPTPTVSAVFEQRRRWGSVTAHYQPVQILLLSLVFQFYLLIAFTAAASIFNRSFLTVFAALLLVKFAGELILLIPGTRIFRKKELRPFILPASLIQLPMVLGAILLGVFCKFNWKGQKMSRTIKKS
ncbi:MAG: glycosyltransferase [Chitinispirillales bacterium]|jgi:cellulose synthase/poly-beta-1,6-N-acetylglucosamine synthase-like glycosyltransferase|nr:glycosyltransferase [Chitinispirillales bacterium]